MITGRCDGPLSPSQKSLPIPLSLISATGLSSSSSLLFRSFTRGLHADSLKQGVWFPAANDGGMYLKMERECECQCECSKFIKVYVATPRPSLPSHVTACDNLRQVPYARTHARTHACMLPFVHSAISPTSFLASFATREISQFPIIFIVHCAASGSHTLWLLVPVRNCT